MIFNFCSSFLLLKSKTHSHSAFRKCFFFALSSVRRSGSHTFVYPIGIGTHVHHFPLGFLPCRFFVIHVQVSVSVSESEPERCCRAPKHFTTPRSETKLGDFALLLYYLKHSGTVGIFLKLFGAAVWYRAATKPQVSIVSIHQIARRFCTRRFTRTRKCIKGR